MKQPIRNKKKSEMSLKRMISDRFFQMVQEAIDNEVVKNQREFALRIDEDQAEFSKIKNPFGKRYVDIEMIWKAVNNLGLNANHILVEDGQTSERLQRDGVTINGGTIHGGQNNVVLTGQAVANHGDVYYSIEKKIEGKIPVKDKKEIMQRFDEIQKRSAEMISEIEELKKNAVRYEREIEKDKKIIEAQDKLIKFLESERNQKKQE